MDPHTRAIIAASAFSFVTGKKVAGVYDHSAGHDRRIAAEVRGDRIQGFDESRGAKFGGTLPELFDEGDKAYFSCELEGNTAKGYYRISSHFYEANVADGMVQLYDHGESAWFSYDIQDADAAESYYRTETTGN